MNSNINAQRFDYPLDDKPGYTNPYGPRLNGYYQFHEGFDMHAPTGTTVKPITYGTVFDFQHVGDDYEYIVIKHLDENNIPFLVSYMHIHISDDYKTKGTQITDLSKPIGWTKALPQHGWGPHLDFKYTTNQSGFTSYFHNSKNPSCKIYFFRITLWKYSSKRPQPKVAAFKISTLLKRPEIG
jgi:murein DD-endopeptidase MepM/ murein hydrolase activator NlpD